MNADTAGRYEEGDVVGIFPDKTKSNNKTYLDLLTPSNHTEAILAGVITRSYYIAANSQEGTARVQVVFSIYTLLKPDFVCTCMMELW